MSKKMTINDVKFAYSKATMDFRDEYNRQIDEVIAQLEDIKIKDDKFDVSHLQHIATDLSRVNSASNRKHVEKAYRDFYDSVTLDLENCVNDMSKE